MIAAFIGLSLAFGVCLCMIAVAYRANKSVNHSSYQSMIRYGIETQLIQDKHELASFGLAQLLGRRLRGLAIAGLSFNGMALIGSAALLFGPALYEGGMSIIGIGLPIIGLFSIIVSACLAELTSAIPTAGSIYHAAFKLGGRRWEVRTGWFNAAGHLALLALYISGCAYLIDTIASESIGYTSTAISFWGIVVFIAFTQAATNHWGSSLLKWIGATAIWLQLFIAGSVLAGLVWLFWPGGYSPIFLYQFQTISFEGSIQPNSFILGCILLLKLFIGIDGSAHGAEETIEPKIRVPWEIFLSTAYSFVIGFVLLAFMALITGLIGDNNQLVSYSASMMGLSGIELFVQGAIAGWGGSTLIALLIIFSLWGSGQQSMMVCARALFSLARDESIPLSNQLSKVCVHRQQPLYAGWFSAILSILLIVIILIVREGGVLLPLLSIAIITLHISYAIPFGLRLKRWWETRGMFSYKGMTYEQLWKDAPWQLGTWSKPLHSAAFVWLLVSAVMTAIFVDLIGIIVIASLLLGITVKDLRDNRQKQFGWKDRLDQAVEKRSE